VAQFGLAHLNGVASRKKTKKASQIKEIPVKSITFHTLPSLAIFGMLLILPNLDIFRVI